MFIEPLNSPDGDRHEKELIENWNCKLSCTSCSLIDQLHPIEKPLFLEISPKLFFMLPGYPPLSLR